VAHTVTCMHKHITNRARTMSKKGHETETCERNVWKSQL